MTAAFFLSALLASSSAPLQTVLDEYRDAQDVPGVSAVVVRADKVLFSGAAGLEDLRTDAPMSADSVVYIGSVSKVLTAVLVLRLVEAGDVSLNDPVKGLELPQKDGDPPITVAHLLSHSSGLQREGNFGYWFTADFPDSEALGRYLATTTLRSPPGSSLHYSNIGYAVLGRLVEQITGKRYVEALDDQVLKPLEMQASGGRGPAADPVMGYTPIGRILPSAERAFAGVGDRTGRRHERVYHDARSMSPAFGAYASANDMGRFVAFLLGAGGDEVLSEAGRALLYEPQGSGRGLGLRPSRLNGRKVARHDGWFAAHRAHLLLDLENAVGVVVLANSDDADPGEIADALLEAAIAQGNTE